MTRSAASRQNTAAHDAIANIDPVVLGILDRIETELEISPYLDHAGGGLVYLRVDFPSPTAGAFTWIGWNDEIDGDVGLATYPVATALVVTGCVYWDSTGVRYVGLEDEPVIAGNLSDAVLAFTRRAQATLADPDTQWELA